MNTSEPARRVSSREVYERLRREILAGRLPPGTALREIALAERYGVSRTPVREALRRLEHDKLLEAGDRGLRVRRPTHEEVVQVYDARILLEGAAAEQAARMRGEADLALLDGLVSRDLALADPGPVDRADNNIEFHQAVWRATHNPVLIDLLQRLSLHLIHTPTTTLTAPGRWEQSLTEHQALIAAIRDGDAEGAGEVAREHLRTARDIRLRMWRERAPRAPEP
ncbi:MAG TPA: GntR family transcriptional regulator [Streptosporangiaceae bacterium]|nr:GntR family transcriptional regulator [Streptosporangiaceae bacterium]